MLAAVLALSSSAAAQPGTPPAKGRLLVASEGLRDPNFERTVVLLLEHGASGTLGLVLNRPSSLPVEKLLPDFESGEGMEETFYVGGPVEIHHMSMLFSTGKEHTTYLHVLGNVYAGWDGELLERMVKEPREEDRFRLYAGHAGWAPGQLEAEIEARGWYVFPGSESVIFGDGTGGSDGHDRPDRNEELWRDFIRRTRTRIAAIPKPDPKWEAGRFQMPVAPGLR